MCLIKFDGLRQILLNIPTIILEFLRCFEEGIFGLVNLFVILQLLEGQRTRTYWLIKNIHILLITFIFDYIIKLLHLCLTDQQVFCQQ